MVLDPRDFVSRHLYISGDYETMTTRLFAAILGPGDRVLDIGANIGYFTLISSHLVGPDGKVYSFEASPVIYTMFQKHCWLNGCDNVVLYNKAVSASKGILKFHTGPEDHFGISSLREIDGGRTHQVEAISLNDILSEIEQIRLVKIDVEGAEHEVLRGMTELIERDRPYIILELTDKFLREMGSSAAQVLEFLQSMRYRTLSIDWDKLREMSDVSGQCNVLCCPLDGDGKSAFEELSPGLTQNALGE
jgi:FkbM family methyltransferase